MTRIEVSIPEGSTGAYQVAHYNRQTQYKMWQTYLNMKAEPYDNHTVLIKNTCPMPIMQNSQAEYNEHQWLWDNATGDVLIGGLGLGMIHQALIDNPNVTSVTIIELEQDVADLVWEHCAKDDTFNLVIADFETWTPPAGSSFDTVWGDTWLWDNSLTYQEYKALITNRYSQYTDNIGFWETA
tara:strand:+ start:252 stop:800 length:549 start_codon:yes stop_codon:yes gene_type:complete